MGLKERATIVEVTGSHNKLVKLRNAAGEVSTDIEAAHLQRSEGNPLVPCFHEPGDFVFVRDPVLVTRGIEGGIGEGIVDTVQPLKVIVGDREEGEEFQEVWMRLEVGENVQYRSERGGWEPCSVIASRESGRVYDIVPHAANQGVYRDWPEFAMRRRPLAQTSQWFSVVQQWLRDRIGVSLDGRSQGETLCFPGEGSGFEGYSEKDTVAMDAFLYDDEMIDELVDEGKLTRSYCTDCCSKRCKPVKYVSHSLALTQFQFLFDHLGTRTCVFEPGELQGKVLLDVGSRTGAALMCALRYRGAELREVVGVEINPYFCQVQRDLVKEFDTRARIVEGDIFGEEGLKELERADVILLHNVFQWFHEHAKQRDLWVRLRNATKKRPGVTVISVPSISSLVEPLGLNWEDWLEEVPLEYPGTGIEEVDEGMELIYKYKTKEQSHPLHNVLPRMMF